MSEALEFICSVLDQGEGLALLVSPTGELLHVSRALLQVLGATVEAAMSHPLPRFYSESTFQQLRRLALPAVSRQGSWEGEGTLETFDGRPSLPVRMRMYVVRHPSSGVLCLMIEHYLDLDRRRAEEAESLKNALLESSLDPVVLVNADGRIVEFNRAAQRTFGHGRETVLGKRPEEVLFPPESATAPTQRVERHLATGEGSLLGRRTEVLASRANGDLFPAEMAMTISYVGGAPLFAFFLRDISQRKQAEQSLRESEMRLQSILDNTPAVVYVKSPDGKYQLINRSFETLFHVTRSGLVGVTDYDVFPAEMADVFRANDRKVRDARMPLVFEEVAPHDDGPHTYLSVKFPLFDASGGVQSVCGISTDITHRISVEAALRHAKEAAEGANQAKSLFLANMSHEIRTPLNAIIGLTELVLQGVSSPEHREYLTMVRNSGESLLSVINDILDFSKIEAGKLDLEQTDFDLRETLGDAMKSLAFRAHSKGLELSCRISPEVPAAVAGDPARLRQAVVNLVGNAIKFTECGQVDLDVTVQSRDAGGVVLHFAVRDTGIGIPPEKQEQIFDAFEQADTSMTRRFGGTGLGLAISRRLVELMGGRIWLESTVDRGSTFHFTSCLENVDRSNSTPGGASRGLLAGMKALVVDDNATNRFILEEMLHNWDLTTSVAGDAQQALDQMLRAKEAGAPFPLVLIDAQMPMEDGFALVRRARQTPGLLSGVIMMLGSGDLPGDIGRCDQLGLAHHLLKPVKQSELLDMILQIHGVPAESPGVAEISSQPVGRRALKILLAEDSPVNQKLALGVLGRQGHSVTIVTTGREALAAIAREKFDLILMDIQMPEMDGLQATAAIRQQEAADGGHIPIVAMTAHAMKGDRERCLESGMDGYVAKPVRSRELFATIEEVLRQSRQVSETAASPLASDQSTEEILNWEQLLAATDGDRDSLRELLAAFEGESRQMFAEIDGALPRRDAPLLRRAAHTLQGSARVFASETAQRAAQRLEQLARLEQFEQAPAAAEELRRVIARLLDSLRNRLSEG